MYIGIVALVLLFCAATARAHVSWESLNGVTCPSLYSCQPEPIVLPAGTQIEVVYNVIVQHGGPIQIDYTGPSDGMTNSVLAADLPEEYGLNTANIQLPNVTCDSCKLTVQGSGYSGSATISLVDPNTLPTMGNPEDVADVLSIAEDNQIHLMWQAPPQTADRILIVQATHNITDGLVEGNAYQVSDTIGDGVVVYAGSGEDWIARGLMRDTEYYFKLFSATDSLTYSPGIEVHVQTTDIGNNPPWVSLDIAQQGAAVDMVWADAGSVIIRASVADADSQDSHWFDWSGSSSELVNLAGEDGQFVFDPVELDEGQYRVQVEVTDGGTPALTATAEVSIHVHAADTHEPMPAPKGKKKGGAFVGDIMVWWLLLIFFAQQRTRRTRRPPKHE